MEHPHRLLEYAPTGRSTCHGHCKSKIGQGELRFGTKVVVQDHESVSWRCIDCVVRPPDGATKSLFLTARIDAPASREPPRSGRRARLFSARLSDRPSTRRCGRRRPREGGRGSLPRLRRCIARQRCSSSACAGTRAQGAPQAVCSLRDQGMAMSTSAFLRSQGRSSLQKRKTAKVIDTHAMDAQLRDDPTLTHLWTVGDLRALCVHHGLSDKGTKPTLEARLHEHYAVAPQ